MTPAERARQIDREEFEAECAAVRARALAYSRKCRELEAERLMAWLHDRKKDTTVPFNAAPLVKRYSAFGHNRTTGQWAEATGVPFQTLRYRLNNGWTIERALTEPVMTVAERAQRRRNANTIHRIVASFDPAKRRQPERVL